MICLAVPGLGAAALCPGWSRTRGWGCASTVAHSPDRASLSSLYVRGRDLVTDGLFPWEGGLAGCLAGIWQLGLGVEKEMQGKVDDKNHREQKLTSFAGSSKAPAQSGRLFPQQELRIGFTAACQSHFICFKLAPIQVGKRVQGCRCWWVSSCPAFWTLDHKIP